jgi:hypothetical protein
MHHFVPTASGWCVPALTTHQFNLPIMANHFPSSPLTSFPALSSLLLSLRLLASPLISSLLLLSPVISSPRIASRATSLSLLVPSLQLMWLPTRVARPHTRTRAREHAITCSSHTHNIIFALLTRTSTWRTTRHGTTRHTTPPTPRHVPMSWCAPASHVRFAPSSIVACREAEQETDAGKDSFSWHQSKRQSPRTRLHAPMHVTPVPSSHSPPCPHARRASPVLALVHVTPVPSSHSCTLRQSCPRTRARYASPILALVHVTPVPASHTPPPPSRC